VLGPGAVGVYLTHTHAYEQNTHTHTRSQELTDVLGPGADNMEEQEVCAKLRAFLEPHSCGRCVVPFSE